MHGATNPCCSPAAGADPVSSDAMVKPESLGSDGPTFADIAGGSLCDGRRPCNTRVCRARGCQSTASRSCHPASTTAPPVRRYPCIVITSLRACCISHGVVAGKRKPFKGILMYGVPTSSLTCMHYGCYSAIHLSACRLQPPGTGKSFLAKALSNEAKSNFYPITAGDLVSKWMGESEQ